MLKPQSYFTVKQAAAYLGVAPNTIRNWDRDGKITVYRHPISRYRLFKEKDLRALLEQIEATAAPASNMPSQRRRKPK
jgi:MerR family copper efflux transcriptional regulator